MLASYGIRTTPSFEQRVANLPSGGGNNLEAVYNEYLKSDIKDTSLPCLPPNVATRNMETMKGLYVLQVTSIKNIGVSKEEREKGDDARGKRTLMFCFTDGAQEVVGVEFEPLHDLKLADIGYGTKFAVENVTIRRGIMLLTARNFKRLGGSIPRPPVDLTQRDSASEDNNNASGIRRPSVVDVNDRRKRRKS